MGAALEAAPTFFVSGVGRLFGATVWPPRSSAPVPSLPGRDRQNGPCQGLPMKRPLFRRSQERVVRVQVRF
ncbi:MAG: hypothetical protein AB1609_20785, partial [Bacillota bacterium]